MDMVAFHRALLGRVPEHTPKAFHLTERQRYLYEAYPHARGFSIPSGSRASGELLLATFVLALAQTSRSSEPSHRVYLLAPRRDEKWVTERGRGLFRYARWTRRADKEGLDWLVRVYQQLTPIGITWRTIQQGPPSHWVAFNLCRDSDHLPDWLREALIEVDDG
jgi:hypothetical protein